MLNVDQLRQLKQLDVRAQSDRLASEDRELVMALIKSYMELTDLLEDPDTTLDDLSPFIETCEKYRQVEDTDSERRDSLPDK
jgi:hypothetical protein